MTTQPTKRGGKRPNAGRKKKWGDKPTVRYVRVVPADMVDELDRFIAAFSAGHLTDVQVTANHIMWSDGKRSIVVV